MAVCEEGVRVHQIAIQEVPRSGKPEELMAKYGINAECIVKKVKALLK
jgi:transketolase